MSSNVVCSRKCGVQQVLVQTSPFVELDSFTSEQIYPDRRRDIHCLHDSIATAKTNASHSQSDRLAGGF